MAHHDDALVIWDFDWSLVNDNTDTWVVQKLLRDSGEAIMSSRTRDTSWTKLMAECMVAVHAEGHTARDIRRVLQELPVFDDHLDIIREAHGAGVRQVIVSDANTVFIEELLAHHDVRHCFTDVVTNPAHYNGDGLLVVRPHQSEDAPHDCALCPSNLCKGNIVAGLAVPRRVVYVGDGSGDLCPCLRLPPSGTVLARDGARFRLLPKLRTALEAVADDKRPTVVPWTAGAEVAAAIRAALLLST